MAYLGLLMVLLTVTNTVISQQPSHRKIYIYHEVGREPYATECRESALTGSRRLVAIHVVDNSAFTEPCHCLLFNTEDEELAEVVNVKYQSPTSTDNMWTQVEAIRSEQWSHLGYGGLYLHIQQDHVTFVLDRSNVVVEVAVAIEVGGSGYMHIFCQNEAFTSSTTSATSTTEPTPFVFEVEISKLTTTTLLPVDPYNATLSTTDAMIPHQAEPREKKAVIILYCIGFILGFTITTAIFVGIVVVIKRRKLEKQKESDVDGLRRENYYESMDSSLGSIHYTDDQDVILFNNGNFTLRRPALYGGSSDLVKNSSALTATTATLPQQTNGATDLCQIEEVNHEFENHSPFIGTCSHQNPLFDEDTKDIEDTVDTNCASLPE